MLVKEQLIPTINTSLAAAEDLEANILMSTAYPLVYRPNATSYLLADVAVDLVVGVESEAKILDLGTGSGIVALTAAAANRMVRATATDISGDACRLCSRLDRLQGTNLKVLDGDWFAPVAGERFDLIFSHPPAVPYPDGGDWGLPPAIRVATNGGVDGTRCISHLVDEAPSYLAVGGKLVLGLPHWASMARVMDLLGKRYRSVAVAAIGQAPFFPLLDGAPDDQTLTHFWRLASEGVIEVNMRDGVACSPISVVVASL